MSKSTLSIIVPVYNDPNIAHRTIEVPCRLPEAFTFWFHLPHYGAAKATAYLSEWELDEMEVTVGLPISEAEPIAASAADSLLASVKSVLGLSPSTHSVAADVILSAIALAYESEVAAYDAALKAYAALPGYLYSLALAPNHPAENDYSPAVLMLRKYVEHVVEQACKAQTERAEAQAKEAK
jgi:hypothetical protein